MTNPRQTPEDKENTRIETIRVLEESGTCVIEYNEKDCVNTFNYFDDDVVLSDREIMSLLYLSAVGNYTIRYEGRTFNP